jgi:hypothetical protein
MTDSEIPEDAKYTLDQIKTRLRRTCFDLLDKGATEAEIICAVKDVVSEHIELPCNECSQCVFYHETMKDG